MRAALDLSASITTLISKFWKSNFLAGRSVMGLCGRADVGRQSGRKHCRDQLENMNVSSGVGGVRRVGWQAALRRTTGLSVA